MTKAIYFDMDGTIANLYGVEKWLEKLRAKDAEPYKEATPMVDMKELSSVCRQLQAQGYIIGVISWLSMGSTKEYDAKVREAKREWLGRYFNCEIDEMHLVKYGTPKHTTAKLRGGVLVDDNAEVGHAWAKHKNGWWVDAKNFDIVAALRKLAG